MSDVLRFRIHDGAHGNPVREVRTPLSAADLARLDREGVLHIPQAIPAVFLARLRTATDRLVDQHLVEGGGFLRDLPVRDAAFADLMADPLCVGTARAMLGPQIRVRGITARICRAGQADGGFGWHIHHRVWPDPVPPWFAAPQAMDVLVYLDDLGDGVAGTAVVPGSHRQPFLDLPWNGHDEVPGQRVLSARAGDAVIMHGNLWHRALPAAGTRQRRLLILGYTPAWYRGCPYGEDPEILSRLATGETEWDELCGVGGYT